MFDLFFFYLPHEDRRKANTTYALLELLLISARRVGFNGSVYFYTHEQSEVPDDLPITRVVRIAPKDVPTKDLIHLRAHALNHFVNSEYFCRPTISIEADQLFQRNPMMAFDLPFDIGLTYPHWDRTTSGDFGQLNGGVIYINNSNPSAFRSYYLAYTSKFLEIKDQIDRRFPRLPRLAEWGGDEICHMRLLPPHALQEHNQKRQCFTVHGARVMVLESAIFNCQQGEREGDDIVCRYYPDAIIRHFVNWRMKLIPEYADRYLGLTLEPSPHSSWGTRVIEREIEVPGSRHQS